MKSSVERIELKRKCACRGYNLDKFIQPIILMILKEGDCSGYAIIKQMPNYSMFRLGAPDATGVYRHLKSMEARNHIRSYEYEDKNGKKKSNFAITQEGMECLTAWKQTLLVYQIAINDLIKELSDV